MKINKIQILSIIVLVLISVFLVFFNDSKNNTESENIDSENLISDDNDNNIEDSLVIDDSLKTEQINPDLKKFDKKEFDRIMTLGSNAFNQQKYQEAISYYKQALAMEELDVIYAKMYLVYKSINDNKNALFVLEKARNLNPTFNQYWFWTIEFHRDVYKASYSELETIYKEAFDKVELTAKINLVTFFASVSEQMNQKEKSIILWQKAIELNPRKKDIYQAEIDRLKAL
jgi:tetratricopeptide (TPR) repeat protein